MTQTMRIGLAGITVVTLASAAAAQVPEPAQDNDPARADVAPVDGAPPPQPSGEPTRPVGETAEQPRATEVDLAEIEAALAADAAELTPAPAQGGAVPPAQRGALIDLGATLSMAAAWFSADGPGPMGAHDPEATGLHVQALELSLASAIDPYFRFNGTLAVSDHGFELEEGYVSTDGLGHNVIVRAGQFLSRFGRIAGTHPHQWRFVDQTMLVGRIFGGEGPRAPGLEASYLTPLPWFVEATLAVNEASGEEAALSFLADGDFELDHPGRLMWTATVDQFFDLSDNWSLLMGGSYVRGPNGVGDPFKTRIAAIDGFLKYRPISRASYTEFTVQGEYAHRRRWQGGDKLGDQNGYLELGLRFARRLSGAVRQEFGTAELGRDGAAAAAALDRDWNSTRQRTAAVMTFSPTEFSRLRLQLGADYAAWLPDSQISAFLSLEVAAGAHGAHVF